MSRRLPKEIKCPKCGTSVNTMLWGSLNVTIDPDVKEYLLEGKVNLFQCTNCNFKAPLSIPFLYHDMENKFCVQYYPFESLEDKNFFDNFLPNGKIYIPNLPEERFAHLNMKYMEDTHIVFSMEELIHYVIFRDKLIEAKKNSKWNMPFVEERKHLMVIDVGHLMIIKRLQNLHKQRKKNNSLLCLLL
jgi:hypothetical protein